VCSENINAKSTGSNKWKAKLDIVKDFRLTPLGRSHSDSIDDLKAMSSSEWAELSHYITCKCHDFIILLLYANIFIGRISYREYRDDELELERKKKINALALELFEKKELSDEKKRRKKLTRADRNDSYIR
jgi:hypothetical protein